MYKLAYSCILGLDLLPKILDNGIINLNQLGIFKESNENNKAPKTTQQVTPCAICGEKGHKASQCQLSKPKCRYCGKFGHIEKICIAKSSRCYKCGIKGHKEKECFRNAVPSQLWPGEQASRDN